jgi:hypothetical protein
MMLQTETATTASDQDLRPRARALSWMASLSLAAGQIRAAEGYLLELLAWCAFGDREGPAVAADEGA